MKVQREIQHPKISRKFSGLLWFTVISFSTLVSCTPAYKAPTSGATALVRFQALEIEGSAGVYIHKDHQCAGSRKVWELGGEQVGGMSSDSTDYGMIKDPGVEYPKNEYAEVAVSARQPFYFTVSGTNEHGDCFLTRGFIPDSNVQYEVEFLMENNRCTTNVFQISDTSDQFTRVEVDGLKIRLWACTKYWN